MEAVSVDFDEPAKKRKHGKFPYTRMSLEYIRAQGRVPEIVERLIPTGQSFPKRHDAWGVFDIMWIDPATKEMGFVQTTSWQQRSAHKKTITTNGKSQWSGWNASMNCSETAYSL